MMRGSELCVVDMPMGFRVWLVCENGSKKGGIAN